MSNENQTSYLILSKLKFEFRFAIIVILVVVGIGYQLYAGNLIPGVVATLAAAILSLRKNISVSISPTSGSLEWEEVPFEKWNDILTLKKKHRPLEKFIHQYRQFEGHPVFYSVHTHHRRPGNISNNE
jgi:hypothetical protein